jgi:hypothetical protein
LWCNLSIHKRRDRPEQNDELERLFDGMLADKTEGSNVHDFPLRRAVAALGKAVLRLDRSSSELSYANIRLTRTYTWLTVIILLVGIAQIILMVRGR